MRRRFVLGATTLACALYLAPGALAASNDLYVSEYVEGSSNNKALELHNDTGGPSTSRPGTTASGCTSTARRPRA